MTSLYGLVTWKRQTESDINQRCSTENSVFNCGKTSTKEGVKTSKPSLT